MSNARFSILQAQAVKDNRISDSQFRTLAALGMYGDENGWCFPSLKTIGRDLGKSKQAVGRDTIALRKLGYLEVYRRFDEKTQSRRSNLYRLKYDLPTLTSQRQVDAPSTPDVDAPSTPDVDNNVPLNVPSKALAGVNIDMPLEWKIALDEPITPLDLDAERMRKEAVSTFERVLGYNPLPWSSTALWEKFEKFVVKITASNPNVWQEYVLWREGQGRYKAFSNRKIRENPQMFMDTGIPEFEASKMYAETGERQAHAL